MNGRHRRYRFPADGQLCLHRLRIANPDRRKPQRAADLAIAQGCKWFGQPLFLDQQKRLASDMPIHGPFRPEQSPAQAFQPEARRARLHRARKLEKLASNHAKIAPLRQCSLIRIAQLHVRRQQRHMQAVDQIDQSPTPRPQRLVGLSHHGARRGAADRIGFPGIAHHEQGRVPPSLPAACRRSDQRRGRHRLPQRRKVGQHQCSGSMRRIRLPHDRAGGGSRRQDAPRPRHPPQRQPHRHGFPLPLLQPPAARHGLDRHQVTGLMAQGVPPATQRHGRSARPVMAKMTSRQTPRSIARHGDRQVDTALNPPRAGPTDALHPRLIVPRRIIMA